jgi:hypothetical protein
MNEILNQIKKEMGYSNAEDAENAENYMLEMAEHYDSLDEHDFEQMDPEEHAEYAEFLEMLEMAEDAEKKNRHKKHLLHRKGHAKHNPNHGGRHHGGAHHTATQGTHHTRALDAIGGGGSFSRKGGASATPPAYGSADYIRGLMTAGFGDINITVSRATANINSVLPYILFGVNGFSSSFISTLKQYLPAGVTCAVSSDPTNGDMLMTFTAAGPLVDVVRITLTGSQISYTEFLQNMNQNFFKTRYIKQGYVNDSNLLLATSQQVQFGLLSALGSKSANNLLPRSRSLTTDYQPYNINLLLPEQKVTADFSFVQNIIPVANTVVGWDVFFSARTNLNEKL